MTNERFDYPSFFLGVYTGTLILFIIAWVSVHGYDLWNQYRELIGGFVMGFGIMYCIHKIDWEAGLE